MDGKEQKKSFCSLASDTCQVIPRWLNAPIIVISIDMSYIEWSCMHHHTRILRTRQIDKLSGKDV